MDAPIASIGLQPAPQRPDPSRAQPIRVVQPASPLGETGKPISSTASEAADRVNNRLNAERSFDRDADTGALIYRLIDLSSGIVTIQTPSDARLKLRAYLDGVIAAAAPPAIEVVA